MMRQKLLLTRESNTLTSDNNWHLKGLSMNNHDQHIVRQGKLAPADRKNAPRINFLVLDGIHDEMSDWFDKHNILDPKENVFVNADGIIINLSEQDFTKFKNTLNLVETNQQSKEQRIPMDQLTRELLESGHMKLMGSVQANFQELIMRRQSSKTESEGWGVVFTMNGKQHLYARPFKTRKQAIEYRDAKCGKDARRRGYKVVRMKQIVTTTYSWEETARQVPKDNMSS